MPGALVLVDGYNVAKLAWPDDDLAAQRTRCLDLVDDVARRFGTDVTVVFDGADVVGAHARRRRLARVVYSPAGRDGRRRDPGRGRRHAGRAPGRRRHQRPGHPPRRRRRRAPTRGAATPSCHRSAVSASDRADRNDCPDGP